ncbi:MAG: hypothetical protein KAR38_02145 [Calditrichia bacterium]|nr:hypothetical protein [Calditrichia bacterium]
MKNLIFKISLLIFMISMLAGIYTRLPFVDNIIRSFVIFVLFFIAIWIIMLVYVQTLAISRKDKYNASQDHLSEDANKNSVNVANS